MIKRFLPLFVLLLLAERITAQELNCRVIINSDQVQSSDRRIFDDMQTAFTNFLNNQKWTEDIYEPEERIKCNIIVTLQNPSTIGNFQATVQIQSARPVYNSNYETILLNFADRDWQFQYVDSQPLNFNQNTFTDNLTSLLAFYAYIIIGMDYDSFSPLGGSDYFQIALNIANNAQQANRPGWDALGSTRNRYWLVENLTNSQMQQVRNGLYDYHIKGLDLFQEKPDEARQNIIKVLEALQVVKRTYPNSILVISFLDAKKDELINIYSEGDLQVRRKAYEILTTIDPAQTTTYQAILSSR